MGTAGCSEGDDLRRPKRKMWKSSMRSWRHSETKWGWAPKKFLMAPGKFRCVTSNSTVICSWDDWDGTPDVCHYDCGLQHCNYYNPTVLNFVQLQNLEVLNHWCRLVARIAVCTGNHGPPILIELASGLNKTLQFFFTARATSNKGNLTDLTSLDTSVNNLYSVPNIACDILGSVSLLISPWGPREGS